MFYIG